MSKGLYNEVVSRHFTDSYFGAEADNLFGSKKRKLKQAGVLAAAGQPIPKALMKKVAKAATSKKSKQRARVANTLDLLAKREGKPIEDVALKVVSAPENIEQMQKYVTAKGEIPLSNPAELATQAYVMRNDDVQQISDELGLEYDDAEYLLEDVESELEEEGNGEAENFLGGLISAIGPVAKKGLAKISAKKQAAGKNGLFAKLVRKGDRALNGGVASNVDANGAVISKEDINGAIDKVKEQEKKKEIKKMLPLIIGGVILLILVVVLITRKTSK